MYYIITVFLHYYQHAHVSLDHKKRMFPATTEMLLTDAHFCKPVSNGIKENGANPMGFLLVMQPSVPSLTLP